MGRKKHDVETEDSQEEVLLTEEAKDFIAMKSIEEYFHDKSWWCGGPIPRSELINECNVRLVRSTDLETAFRLIYEQLIPKVGSIPEGEDPTSLAPDIVYALELLHDAHSRALPRIHIPGLLLLYFKVCKGLHFDSFSA